MMNARFQSGPLSWRRLITYPQYVSGETNRILDTLVEILSVPDIDDRYVCLSEWLRTAESAGLITSSEHYRLRSDIAKQM